MSLVKQPVAQAEAQAQSPQARLREQLAGLIRDAQSMGTLQPKFGDVKIRRDGREIILPDGMTYSEAHYWLNKQEEAEEKTVGISCSIPCFPLDGAIALRRAMEDIFGFSALADTPGFFGPQPPVLVQVDLARGGFETAPMGRMCPPHFEGGFINAHCDEMALIIAGEVKKKFEREAQHIITRTKELLRSNSIYRSQSIVLDLQWLEEETDFHPVSHAPKFLDVSDVDEGSLLLNRAPMFALTANVWTIIEQTEACRKNNIPLKHGVVLGGPFGVGKTLTARITAKKCVRSGWTFIYLKTPGQLARALKLAELYAPTCLFCEDIDEIVSGERDEDLNEILNTLDGVDTKTAPIITILTTNNMEAINPAILRAGRIDTIIELGKPDGETAKKFVELYARDDDNHTLLAPGVDLAAVGAAFGGYVPAFIGEAVQKAKRIAIHREKSPDITGKLLTEDLLGAAEALAAHQKLVNREQPETEEMKTSAAVRQLFLHGLRT